jgi:hypothetical protein
MFMGVFILLIGFVFMEQSYHYAGSFYLIAGGLGLLFMTERLLLYTLLISLLYVFTGVILYYYNKKRAAEKAS